MNLPSNKSDYPSPLTHDEPLNKNYSTIYFSLVSVVVGFALAEIAKDFSLRFWDRNLLVFITVCVVWHRYATQIRFFGWEYDFWDTLLPMGYSFLLLMIAGSIKKGISQFVLAYLFLASWALIAYVHLYFQFKKEKSKVALHRMYFRKDSVYELSRVLISFAKATVIYLLVVVGLLFLSWIYFPYLESVSGPNFPVLLMGFMLMPLVFFDLKFFLWRSDILVGIDKEINAKSPC